jgi:hypothetical protein
LAVESEESGRPTKLSLIVVFVKPCHNSHAECVTATDQFGVGHFVMSSFG